LEATRDVRARIDAVAAEVTFDAGERLLVEHSHKFRIEPLTAELGSAGLEVTDVHEGEGFASLVARPA
jgi:uncharacterized SAM-dependent methyltransferase